MQQKANLSGISIDKKESLTIGGITQWYKHSAHLPNFEEPEKFCDFCKSLLNES